MRRPRARSIAVVVIGTGRIGGTPLSAPGEPNGAPGAAAGHSPTRRVVALARDAVSRRVAGSRAEIERLTVARIDASLLVFVLSARLIHLFQAAIDVTIGGAAYSHPRAAQLAAAGCVVESLLLSAALVRRRRLTMPLLVADAAFGLVGLGVLSYATASTVGRTGSINWMLPYTVVTATALGLLAGRDRGADAGGGSRWKCAWRGCAASLVLAVSYAASISLPGLVPGERAAQVIANAGNYVVFYVGGAAVSIALRRQLRMIAAANEAAKREASQVADESQWRLVAVDVFGPVLDLLERAAEMEDYVPSSLRHEADRLIDLIEATNPTVAIGELR